MIGAEIVATRSLLYELEKSFLFWIPPLISLCFVNDRIRRYQYLLMGKAANKISGFNELPVVRPEGMGEETLIEIKNVFV